jgi:N-methylhydantoinase B
MALYFKPNTLDEALQILARSDFTAPPDPVDRVTIVAGATDYLPLAANRDAWFQPRPRNVLDISGISPLRTIVLDGDDLVIGAGATWTDLVRAPLSPGFEALKQAAVQVGGVQIQNRGTLVGNMCNASPAADGAPPLLALDAVMELRSAQGERRVPLAAFVLGNRSTVLRPDEMVAAIRVPPRPMGEQSVFLKLGARAYLVISIASVAVNLAFDAQGVIVHAAVAVGACAPMAVRLAPLEARLLGVARAEAAQHVLPQDVDVLTPIDDVRATADYRRAAALTLVRRAVGRVTARSSLGYAA